MSEWKEAWEFTIDGDTMVGKVTNLDDYACLGLDSDPGAFVLTKSIDGLAVPI